MVSQLIFDISFKLKLILISVLEKKLKNHHTVFSYFFLTVTVSPSLSETRRPSPITNHWDKLLNILSARRNHCLFRPRKEQKALRKVKHLQHTTGVMAAVLHQKRKGAENAGVMQELIHPPIMKEIDTVEGRKGEISRKKKAVELWNTKNIPSTEGVNSK